MTIYSVGQNLYLRQGDTGQVLIKGLPTDKEYTAYLSVYDEEKGKILAEISTLADNNGEALFLFNNIFSDSLKIGEWVYGLKICNGTGINTMEDTILPRTYVEDGVLKQEDAPLFIVYEKFVEGAE